MLPKNSALYSFLVTTQCRPTIGFSKATKIEEITVLSYLFRTERKPLANNHNPIFFSIYPRLEKFTDINFDLKALPGRYSSKSVHRTTHHPDGTIAVTENQLQEFQQCIPLSGTEQLQNLP